MTSSMRMYASSGDAAPVWAKCRACSSSGGFHVPCDLFVDCVALLLYFEEGAAEDYSNSCLQGLTDNTIPMLQLPHFDQDLLKRIGRKKVKTLQDLFSMQAWERKVVYAFGGVLFQLMASHGCPVISCTMLCKVHTYCVYRTFGWGCVRMDDCS